jgi:CBS-domain-containing membrane protein
MEYLTKMTGVTKSPPRVSLSEIGWSWLGGFLGIAFVSFINYRILDETGLLLMVGSFGASAVLIYGAVKSPLAQPRNVLGGHIISALVGVASCQLFHDKPWLAAAIAVSVAIAAMHGTKTLHPPGGATALIAVIGDKRIHELGYGYALIPVGTGALIMLIVALLVNNIPKNRRYPEYWL